MNVLKHKNIQNTINKLFRINILSIWMLTIIEGMKYKAFINPKIRNLLSAPCHGQ